MAFHEVRLPESIYAGSAAGIQFSTDVTTNDGGVAERDARWSADLRTWDVSKSIQTELQFNELKHFFEAIGKGQLNGFRFKDRGDYEATDTHNQSKPVIILASGSTTTYQLRKTYTYFNQSIHRNIKKPIVGTRIYADDAIKYSNDGTYGWSIDTTTGIITPDTVANWNAAEMTADFEFDWPVRFAIDNLPATWVDYDKRRTRIQLIEDRNL